MRLARELQPDIVILDVSMPELNGIEATRRIVAECPAVRVLALSMHSDRRFVIEMLKAGAAGYLLKDGAFDELIHAIESVMARAAYLSPAITDMVVKEYVAGLPGEEHSAFGVLTPREREVLQLVAEGLPTKAIAARLGLSVKTVETYRQQIMDKLDLHSVAELTKYADPRRADAALRPLPPSRVVQGIARPRANWRTGVLPRSSQGIAADFSGRP